MSAISRDSVLLALLSLLAGVTEPVPKTADPTRHFPRFATRADTLGAIAVVADLAEFVMNGDKPVRVYVDDCREWGWRFAVDFAAALTARGYEARALPVLGVGLGLHDLPPCRVHRRWADPTRKADDFPLDAPPYLADSTLAGSPELLAEWQAVTRAVWDLKLPNPEKDVLAPIAGTDALRPVLGCDYALLAVGRGTKRPAPARIPPPPGAFGEHVDPLLGMDGGPSRWPGSEVRIALLDCRTGEVLWADRCRDRNVLWEERVAQGFSKSLLQTFARDLAGAAPTRKGDHATSAIRSRP